MTRLFVSDEGLGLALDEHGTVWERDADGRYAPTDEAPWSDMDVDVARRYIAAERTPVEAGA